jgi:hypothetical protein
MSNSRDEESRGTNAGPDKSYAVGNKEAAAAFPL